MEGMSMLNIQKVVLVATIDNSYTVCITAYHRLKERFSCSTTYVVIDHCLSLLERVSFTCTSASYMHREFILGTQVTE